MSGPSGVGKGTVVSRLRELRPDLSYSISCTTRAPRPGEREGEHYRFVTPAMFQRLIEEGAFLEWTEIFGNRYGTLLAPIADDLDRGRDVILEIDVRGAATVKERIPESISIFLMPPSEEELARRLKERRTETEEDLARRLAEAHRELEEASWFDQTVVNDEVNRAAAEVAAIIESRSA